MKLSGLDNILRKMYKDNHKIIYGGESAGACVLAPTLNGIELMDNDAINPYGNVTEITRDGLDILTYSVIPHYKSTYNGWWMWKITEDIEKMMKDKDMPYIALQDGEVIIIN